jgi:hypothetical protein
VSSPGRSRGCASRARSCPTNWDGGLASTFSGSLWPGVESGLASMLTQIDQLQDAVASVNRGIAAAGN